MDDKTTRSSSSTAAPQRIHVYSLQPLDYSVRSNPVLLAHERCSVDDGEALAINPYSVDLYTVEAFRTPPFVINVSPLSTHPPTKPGILTRV